MPTSSIVVIVPVYNRAQAMLPTLESVAAQTQPPQRLVVVDDGSRDASAESVEQWIGVRQPAFECQVIRQPNGGASSARNRAIAESSDCEWLAFLDSDDIWPTDFVARAAAALAAQPTAVGAAVDRLFVYDSTDVTRLFPMNEMTDQPVLWMLRYGGGINSCTVVRADLVRELGGFPEHLSTGEDAALYLPLSLHGTWVHLPGQPALINRGLCKPDGEGASLSRRFTDNHRRWARVFESFLAGLTADQHRQIGSARRVRRLMADRWAYAGQELERNGSFLEATTCYARSIRWRPRKLNRWQALFGIPLRAWLGLAKNAA
jgi:glycosyltransferase involved in cell wall biosynthesis